MLFSDDAVYFTDKLNLLQSILNSVIYMEFKMKFLNKSDDLRKWKTPPMII
jgi:hypothetical protein